MTDVRVAAARVLLAVDQRAATLGAALDAASAGVAAADRGLLVELAAGTLRWRNELDVVIASAGRRSVREIEPPVLAVLRLGAYQLRHLDRVPPHAVLHTSVTAVRTLGRTSASSLVNAVLRAIIRRGPAISLPVRPGPDAHADSLINYLTTTLSHPAWLVRRWVARLGFEQAEAWCRFNNNSPEITVRSLDGRPVASLIAELAAAGITAMPAAYVDDAVRLAAGTLGSVPAALRDRLRVQDEAGQLVGRFAGARPGERVLDMCASPGGKALVIADDMALPASGGSGLVAADHRSSRMRLLRDTLGHAGLHVPLVQLDGRVPLPFGPVFDCVLLDAPCSGLGTVRREPDLKWSRQAGDLAEFAETQGRMMRAAAEAVRPGGRLVYATCSSEPEENTGVVDAFLDADARFVPGRLENGRVPASLIDARGHLTTRPDRDGLEGFFAAMLVRREGT